MLDNVFCRELSIECHLLYKVIHIMMSRNHISSQNSYHSSNLCISFLQAIHSTDGKVSAIWASTFSVQQRHVQNLLYIHHGQ